MSAGLSGKLNGETAHATRRTRNQNALSHQHPTIAEGSQSGEASHGERGGRDKADFVRQLGQATNWRGNALSPSATRQEADNPRSRRRPLAIGSDSFYHPSDVPSESSPILCLRQAVHLSSIKGNRSHRYQRLVWPRHRVWHIAQLDVFRTMRRGDKGAHVG
jgi:hypothetical protein